MEILIIGLIIVALMVYTSTRIKRNAAAAYEPEAIEGDGFVIQKPEDFLHNLNADPRYIFEAYSKSFSDEHPKMRIGMARITVVTGSSLETASVGITSNGRVHEDLREVIDGHHYRVISTQETAGEVDLRKRYKLTSRGDTVYKLEVTSLDPDPDARWAETFIDTFRVE